MKRRILLVDDELAILLTLRAILEMNGFEVETAASAREAEQKLKNGVFEMVITDMRMPDAAGQIQDNAGFDVIRVARQQPYDPATAILTAFPTLSNEWQSRGAQSLLVKPVNTNELLRQLEVLLISHQDHKARAQQATAGARGSKVSPLASETARHPASAGKKAV